MRYRFVATVSTCVYIHACIYIYRSTRRMIAWLFAPAEVSFADTSRLVWTRVGRVGRTPFERRLRSHLHTEKSNGCNA